MSGPQFIAESGTSTLEVEEPDIIYYRLRGNLKAVDLQSLRLAEWKWNVGKPILLVVVDVHALDSVAMDARRVAITPNQGTENRAMALVGGSRHIRAIADLALKAATLLGSRSINMRTFDDEKQARSWLIEQRAALHRRS